MALTTNAPQRLTKGQLFRAAVKSREWKGRSCCLRSSPLSPIFHLILSHTIPLLPFSSTLCQNPAPSHHLPPHLPQYLSFISPPHPPNHALTNPPQAPPASPSSSKSSTSRSPSRSSCSPSTSSTPSSRSPSGKSHATSTTRRGAPTRR